MLWRILGIFGAGTFFYSALDIFSDPLCISADFSGGRLVQIACRSDNFGTFSGTQAGFICIFIGLVIIGITFIRSIHNFVRRDRIETSPIDEIKFRTERICSFCNIEVDAYLEACAKCGKVISISIDVWWKMMYLTSHY